MEIQYASCVERLTRAKPCETLTVTQRRTPQGVADLDRNRWPTSIRIGGRLPSEKPADIIGIPTVCPERDLSRVSYILRSSAESRNGWNKYKKATTQVSAIPQRIMRECSLLFWIHWA